MRQACAEAALWPPAIKVAVNLSPVQFKSRGLLESVLGALAAGSLSPDRLELEITESVLLEVGDTTEATLHKLRSLGIRIALDDFGTGYSSLSYLRSFPFDKIKIDRSFTKNLSAGGDACAIVRTVTRLAKDLGMSTTAEGVETKEDLDFLREIGCTEIQGYLISPAVPALAVPGSAHALWRQAAPKFAKSAEPPQRLQRKAYVGLLQVTPRFTAAAISSALLRAARPSGRKPPSSKPMRWSRPSRSASACITHLLASKP